MPFQGSGRPGTLLGWLGWLDWLGLQRPGEVSEGNLDLKTIEKHMVFCIFRSQASVGLAFWASEVNFVLFFTGVKIKGEHSTAEWRT